MIDTDKYEGHTPAPWEEGEYIPSDEMIERFQNRELQGAVMQQGDNLMLAMIGLDGNGEKDRLLIADAPLILEEVKRMHEVNDELRLAIQNVAGFPKRCPPALKLGGVIDAMVCMLREAIE